MKLFYSLLFSVILISCTENVLTYSETKNGDTKLTQGSTFENYSNSIIGDDLPYYLDCNFQFSYFDKSYKVYVKFMPVGGKTYTTFRTDSKFHIIMYTFQGDITWPYLYSFSENGEIIDSIGLYLGSCQDDPWSESRCYTIINTDLSIELSDTVKHYTFDESSQIYDSTTVDTELYKLNMKGEFELISQRTIILGKKN